MKMYELGMCTNDQSMDCLNNQLLKEALYNYTSLGSCTPDTSHDFSHKTHSCVQKQMDGVKQYRTECKVSSHVCKTRPKGQRCSSTCIYAFKTLKKYNADCRYSNQQKYGINIQDFYFTKLSKSINKKLWIIL